MVATWQIYKLRESCVCGMKIENIEEELASRTLCFAIFIFHVCSRSRAGVGVKFLSPRRNFETTRTWFPNFEDSSSRVATVFPEGNGLTIIHSDTPRMTFCPRYNETQTLNATGFASRVRFLRRENLKTFLAINSSSFHRRLHGMCNHIPRNEEQKFLYKDENVRALYYVKKQKKNNNKRQQNVFSRVLKRVNRACNWVTFRNGKKQKEGKTSTPFPNQKVRREKWNYRKPKRESSSVVYFPLSKGREGINFRAHRQWVAYIN